jgi:hypothetical protein
MTDDANPDAIVNIGRTAPGGLVESNDRFIFTVITSPSDGSAITEPRTGSPIVVEGYVLFNGYRLGNMVVQIGGAQSLFATLSGTKWACTGNATTSEPVKIRSTATNALGADSHEVFIKVNIPDANPPRLLDIYEPNNGQIEIHAKQIRLFFHLFIKGNESEGMQISL